ncbi:hypothetical protein RhiirA4_418829 [Rhizophagus irregularis]|uniref:Uncharacterized protein n=1 Tax=Rhizophagus irregularis TaxID=588596 RepID=A0A2I1GC22_9GLOM|nr:hypothetical protein RhiirA4_418829 [Rhizophagus irregularis]
MAKINKYTFFIFNDDENSTATSFFSSNRKSHRLKFLLEEKLYHSRWNCPLCKNDSETFSHIVTFGSSSSITRQILSVFINDINMNVNKEIWKPRCEQMLVDELHAGINKKSK